MAKYNSASRVRFNEWLGRNSVSLRAGVAYVIFSLAVIGGTLLFIFVSDTDNLKIAETLDANDKITGTVRTTESNPIPIDAIIALIGFGGILILPLKYFWEELSNRSANRRKVISSTRERVHAYVEKYYLPIYYALSDLQVESNKWTTERKKLPHCRNQMILDRWIYSFAQVWQARRKMRHEGGSWFFRSHEAEYDVYKAFGALRDSFDERFETHGWERSVLATALEDLKPRNFRTFHQLLDQNPRHPRTSKRWRDIITFRKYVRTVDADAFSNVEQEAGHVADLIRYYATEVYGPWYEDPNTRGDREDFVQAQAWVKQLG